MLEFLYPLAVLAAWIIYGMVSWKTAGLLPPLLSKGPGFHPRPGFWWMAAMTVGLGVLTVWISSSYYISRF